MNCRLILVFVGMFFIHAHYGQEHRCESYEKSKISNHCEELKIENANVCYSYKHGNGAWYSQGRQYWWIAEITCHDGYKKRTNVRNPRCQVHLLSAQWSFSAYQYKCVPVIKYAEEKSVKADKNTENNFARDVAVPILIVLLFGVVLFVVIRELVSRRNIRCFPCFKTNIESQQSHRDVCSQTFDISVVCSPDVNRDSEYHCIADTPIDFDVRVAPAIDDENWEYNFLDDHLNNCSTDRDDLPLHANIFLQATNSVRGTNIEMDTYSHDIGSNVPNNFSRLRFDSIAIDDESNASDLGKHDGSVYNHTNTRRFEPVCAISVHDTNVNVDNDLDITDADDTD